MKAPVTVAWLLTTATLLPRSCTTAASAAVATVLPTSVPVPVTKTTEVSERGSAMVGHQGLEHGAGPLEVRVIEVGMRGEPQP